VAQLVDWKVRQLCRSSGFSHFDREGMRAFILSAAADPAMPLRVAMLRTASSVLASFVLIDGGEAELIYQCAYDPDFAFCSPGALLRHLVQIEAIRRGKTILDFGPGDEPYKADICDTATRLLRIIRPLQPSGAPLAALLRARLAAKRRIKATPALHAAISRANRVRKRVSSLSALRRDPETLESA
jgi:CelD/BcsL family acetyltransferase involved in cellulose biosynthesis